ncbi:MAG TPA: DUF2867 domain-containing protein [Caulobacteraceae bacterium]|nr:DUF2867 domain-containing protein [Caulobacteraceae bacterium]
MQPVRAVAVPAESALAPLVAGAWYVDAFETALADPALTPIAIGRAVFAHAPEWVETLLAWRNRAVRLVGLKDVGRLTDPSAKPPEAYAVGDALSLFTIRSMDGAELVLGLDDRHLDVRLSILKRRDDAGRWTWVLSSVVTTHNALGRAYMLPVAPMHRLIVRTMMRRLGI